MILSTLLKPSDRDQFQRVFPALDLAQIAIELRDDDGPGGVGGRAPGSIWRPRDTIRLDRADFHLVDGLLDLSHPAKAELLAHELTHIEQSMRGFWWRLKMWFWKTFLPYDEKTGKTSRPHELEAYARAAEIRANWS